MHTFRGTGSENWVKNSATLCYSDGVRFCCFIKAGLDAEVGSG